MASSLQLRVFIVFFVLLHIFLPVLNSSAFKLRLDGCELTQRKSNLNEMFQP